MDAVVFQLKQNQDVLTPIGPGTIQGRLVEKGQTIIMVYVDSQYLPEEDLRLSRKGVMVARYYLPCQLTPLIK